VEWLLPEARCLLGKTLTRTLQRLALFGCVSRASPVAIMSRRFAAADALKRVPFLNIALVQGVPSSLASEPLRPCVFA
jgi:hypothetical protein